MAARTYIMDAARSVTAGAIDGGEKPSVPSAMLKYHVTEFGRMIGNDAMDVHGGKGICLGPKNYLGRGYQIVPVAITVEGANILTRSLIIFGQGAVRCHPFVLREMNAARNPDRDAGVAEFDRALMGHIGFAISNAARSARHGAHVGALHQGADGPVPPDALLSACEPLQRLFRTGHRHRHAGARRLSQEKGEPVGAPGRRALGDVSGIDGAEASRESRGPAEDLPLVEWACRSLSVPGPGTAASVPAQFSQPSAGRVDAPAHLPARADLFCAERPAWDAISPI
jgi:acyl-CoA dehydrogenase